jgi:UDP-N-acetylglucosamine--N-acetylmuramyl-(pentapeptide) pyrophosphoryl-undecaprenol N-acetylglucosamine transferase
MPEPAVPSGGVLLVAQTGGHLEELYRLRPRFVPHADREEWATFDDPQSRTMLAGQLVHFVRYVPPRGYRPAAANIAIARQVLREGRFERVVSTGAGIALPFLFVARAMRIPCHYIESAARSQGPSMTGKVVSRIPGVRLYAQYESWASTRWAYRGSLFDGYQPDEARAPDIDQARSVVVMLGTMRTYGFRSAVDRIQELLPGVLAPGASVLWQTGATDVSDLDIRAHDRIPLDQLTAALATADLVIAHAGIGSALTALDLGKCPVLLPRRAQRNEHIDDHQQMIARELAGRELAVSTDVTNLSIHDLRTAMRSAVRVNEASDPFALSE